GADVEVHLEMVRRDRVPLVVAVLDLVLAEVLRLGRAGEQQQPGQRPRHPRLSSATNVHPAGPLSPGTIFLPTSTTLHRCRSPRSRCREAPGVALNIPSVPSGSGCSPCSAAPAPPACCAGATRRSSGR